MPGAVHSDDIFYLFSSAFTSLAMFPKEFSMMTNMVELWTNFASSGVPKSSWNAVLPHDDPPKFLNISNDGMNMVKMPEYDRVKVWNEVYQESRVVLF